MSAPDRDAALRKLAAAARPVAHATVGGFRPPEGLTSRFGGGFHGSPGGTAPVAANGAVLVPLLQVRTDELPGRFPHVSDHALLQLWIDPARVPVIGAEDGDGWTVRSHDALGGLIPLPDPAHELAPRPFPVRWTAATEPPAWESAREVLTDAEETTIARAGFPEEGPEARTKVGGWPSWVQGSAPSLTDPSLFALQVSDEPKAMFGFDGDLYLFRRDGRWVVDVQFT